MMVEEVEVSMFAEAGLTAGTGGDEEDGALVEVEGAADWLVGRTAA